MAQNCIFLTLRSTKNDLSKRTICTPDEGTYGTMQSIVRQKQTDLWTTLYIHILFWSIYIKKTLNFLLYHFTSRYKIFGLLLSYNNHLCVCVFFYCFVFESYSGIKSPFLYCDLIPGMRNRIRSDPLILGLPDPVPLLFSPDPDPT